MSKEEKEQENNFCENKSKGACNCSIECGKAIDELSSIYGYIGCEGLGI
jgi:hypothetical protein